MLGRNEHDRLRVAQAILHNPASWLREIRNGCFTVVVHDHRAKKTYILSDRLGFMPLYLLRLSEGCWFASDLQSLRQMSPRALTLDPVGLAELYWFGYQIGNRTPYKEVSLLPPGSVLAMSWIDGSAQQEYWPVEAPAKPAPPSKEIPSALVQLVGRACHSLYDPSLTYGIKLSGGMDSRMIAGCWSDGPLHAYTWGDSGSAEIRVAALLAKQLGFPHTTIPLPDGFFRQIHPPMFERYGVMDWINDLGNPYMLRDGCVVILDGLLSDVLFAGTLLKRRETAFDNVCYTLGIKQRERRTDASRDAVAELLFRSLRVSDDIFCVVTRDAKKAIERVHDEVLHDLHQEVQMCSRKGSSLDGTMANVKLRNRIRRNIALMGITCRPMIQNLYPFCDNELHEYSRSIPPVDMINKRLYIRVYSEQLKHIRNVPPIMSLLPFTVPQQWHYYGRVVRHLRELASEKLLRYSGGRVKARTMDAFQWEKWLALIPEFRTNLREFIADSRALDLQAFDQSMAQAARFTLRVPGTRVMNTASFCAWHKPRYAS